MIRYVLLVLFFVSSTAYAQPMACAVPDISTSLAAETAPAAEVKRVPILGYLLSLSWSPQYCRGRHGMAQDAGQCGPQARFGFVLHGLWPEGEDQQDPAWCAPAKPLSPQLIRQHFCMTPSAALLQHEWAKHGTCMTNDPATYFETGAQLYRSLRYPDMRVLSRQTHSTASFAAAFARANAGLRPDMLRIMIDQSGWLKEVRLCLGRDVRPRPCPMGEPGKPDQRPVRIWRR